MEVPADTPETTPAEETVATALLLLVHVPPNGVADNAEVAPEHNDSEPVIDAGAPVTVTTALVVQPAALYIIVAVPGATANTIPVAEPTLATARLPDAQVPPEMPVIKVEVPDSHSERSPETEHPEATETTVAALQPETV